MARCPSCGKIWYCLNPDEMLTRYYPDGDIEVEDVHCNKCKCPDCRKEGDRMTIEEEYYGKGKIQKPENTTEEIKG